MAKKLVEVSCAIIMQEDRVLATQRSESMPHPMKWEFPGGKLKVGESPEQSLLREIKEELDIRIRVEQELSSVTHRYNSNYIKLIPFICSIVSGEIDLSEHRAFRWVETAKLGELDWLEADVAVVDLFRKHPGQHPGV